MTQSPKFETTQSKFTFNCIIVGILIAGIYGFFHDQITYQISHEYYTEFKFGKFGFLSSDVPDWILVSKIGFLATSWIGLIAGWFIAKVSFIKGDLVKSYKLFLKGFAILITFSIFMATCFALINKLLPFKTKASLSGYFSLNPSELEAFSLVGNIHHGGSLGAVFGLIASVSFLHIITKTLYPLDSN